MISDHKHSNQAFARASKLMPGGVSSPVRAFKSVGLDPVFVERGEGYHIIDLDGNRYVDYVMSYGPLLLGHAPQAVTTALQQTIERGTSFGMSTLTEGRLAKLVLEAFSNCEQVRFVNSGTEACMSAIRLARTTTGRDKIIKCTGCYHGHVDALLVQAGSGAMTLGTLSSPGVPRTVTDTTLLVPYNDLATVEQTMQQHRGEIAAMLVEPVAGNMGCVPPEESYLQGLRRLCDEHNVLLVFDEVMTGFRVAHGGAQERFGVVPDLTCLGKIIGGGLPCAAYAGRASLMQHVSPAGKMYQAGTLSGNPLAMAAGIAMLESIAQPGVYEQLEATSATLEKGLVETAAGFPELPVQISRVGSMLTVFFCDRPVKNFEDACACNTQQFATFFQAMLAHGVMLPPSQYEAWFVSTAHNQAAIERTLDAVRHGFSAASGVCS